MKNAGKACNNRLYRHIRTFEKIVKNYFVIYIKFVRYFSVDKGSYSEEDLDKIVESNAIRMGKQLLICSEEHAKGSMLEPCGNLAVVAVNDVNSPESESHTIVCIEKQ